MTKAGSERLAGKVAIVTGAGRGIGRAHAIALADAGAAVIVNDLVDSAEGSVAQAVVHEIQGRGGRASISHHDVGEWDAARDLIRTAVEEFGNLDILVNNAGIYRDGPLTDIPLDEWDEVQRVNGRGTYGPLRFAAEFWRERHRLGQDRGAVVVNTTSTAGLKGTWGHAHYGSAKAGVAALTQVAAAELAPIGVRVNAVAPAARTRMLEAMSPAAISEQARSVLGQVDDAGSPVFDPALVSRLVVYLATDGAAVESGQVFLAFGNRIGVFQPWHVVAELEVDPTTTVEDLDVRMTELSPQMHPCY